MEIKIESSKHGSFIALVDDADRDLVSQYKWSIAFTNKGRSPYVCTAIRGVKRPWITLRLHRLIMDARDPKLLVDHINHDTLDNRRSNLRVCSHSENNQNSTIRKKNKAGLKGTYFHPKTGKFGAQIQVRKSKIFLGLYPTAIEAHEAYRQASIKHHGDFACFE